MEFADECPTALYRLYDAGGALLYVGITGALKLRMSQHAAEKPWWSAITRKTVAWYPSRAEAVAAEAEAITLEAPVHNVVGKPLAIVKSPRAAHEALVDELAADYERALGEYGGDERLAGALADALAEVSSPDLLRASLRLHALQESIERARSDAASARAVVAAALSAKYALTISELARVLGLSKQRADQLLRKAHERDCCASSDPGPVNAPGPSRVPLA